jgi:outer membrane protein OmpA-like peptidoglycan-associated protein
MQTRKYTLLLAFFALLSVTSFAQGDASANWNDTLKVPRSGMAQQTDFNNHNYPYPAKPRSKWELGFAAGNSVIFGDINTKPDIGGAITLRKAISHTFSYRLGYFGSYNQGYPSGYGVLIGQRPYQNWSHRGALDFIASLNPASKYRGNPKTNIYVLAGLDLIATRVFFRDPAGTHIDRAYKVFYGGYNFRDPNNQSGIIGTVGGFRDRGGRRGITILGGGSAGAGMAFKLSPKVNIGLEQRFTFTIYDYLDAYRGGNSKDFYSFTSARLNLNIGSSATRTEPLWWINPNNFVYNELNRPTHMLIPPPVLPDADGDGVTDQFDMEPNTPTGAPVDVRGVSKDSDGDGVPDYKDKELLTSSKCFPVSTDGVGTCPEAPCCIELKERINSGGLGTGGTGTGTGTGGEGGGSCGLNNLPSIKFTPSSARLSKEAMSMLSSAAAQIKAQPDCRVRVVGHGTSDKRAQQMSWDRVRTVIRYFVEKQGLSQDRFIFTYGEEGDPNSVDLIGTRESGPNSVPAPHPQFRNNR